MNRAKSLKSFIRGWFPNEPTLPTASSKTDRYITIPPVQLPSGSTLSAVKALIAYAVFWAALGYFAIYPFVSHTSVISNFAWIITGAAIGCITNIAITQRQLKQLNITYKVGINAKDTLLLILPIVALIVPAMALGWFWLDEQILAGCVLVIYAWIVTGFVTKGILFFRYERSSRFRIRQYWLGSGYYVFPESAPGEG